jgi:hypothetical protein
VVLWQQFNFTDLRQIQSSEELRHFFVLTVSFDKVSKFSAPQAQMQNTRDSS